MRDLARAGRLDYVPMSLAAVPSLLSAGLLSFDVAFVQVAPPDDDGICSLGVSVDVTRAAALSAGRIIAEVNPNMPCTGPESGIPLDRIDALVEVDLPVIEYAHPAVGEAARQIARYVAHLIGDGATLQVGLGRVPNEMLRFLEERRGLRIHSDLLTDPVVDLVAKGVVSGPIRGSFAMGTRRLYDFQDGNPEATLAPIEVVCDGDGLSNLLALASVTQAFAIDLSGQVCTERLDGLLYGGVATQPDFHRAAAQSVGGKPIVCLASTFADGTSALRPVLEVEEPVSVPRSDVHWVVTEYGTAYLHGRSLAERAVALIDIAHPDIGRPFLRRRWGADWSQTLRRSAAALPTRWARSAPRHCATVGRSSCDRRARVMQRSCRVSSFGSGTTTSVRVSPTPPIADRCDGAAPVQRQLRAGDGLRRNRR